MAEDRRLPFYLDVDGYRVSGDFLADAVRSALNYKPIPGDIFIVTFPKCGTTWTQQIVNLILDKGVSVSNYMEFNQRSPFMEMCGVEAIDWMIKPGALKYHTPYYLTPQSPEAKYICIVRIPKDTVVSFYHHTHNSGYKFEDGTFDEFFEIFMDGENDFGEYFDHILSWYQHRNDPNVLFLYYENLKSDTPNTIKKIASFLGKEYGDTLENDTGIFENVLKYSSLEHMKRFNDVFETFVEMGTSGANLDSLPNGLRHVLKVSVENSLKPGEVFELVRQGKVGSWKETFSPDQNRRMDEKIEDKLRGTEMYDFWKKMNYI